MQIGDTIWEYRYRSGWISREITGETRVSLLVGPSYRQKKVNKKALAAGELTYWKSNYSDVEDSMSKSLEK